jgi:hypothetical protein
MSDLRQQAEDSVRRLVVIGNTALRHRVSVGALGPRSLAVVVLVVVVVVGVAFLGRGGVGDGVCSGGGRFSRGGGGRVMGVGGG